MSENGRRRDSIFAGPPVASKRPFLNSALFYAGLAGVGFLFLLATGQSADRAAIGMAFAFAAATSWTWLRISRTKREQRRRDQRRPS